MSASLVGSEMCIRDRFPLAGRSRPRSLLLRPRPGGEPRHAPRAQRAPQCVRLHGSGCAVRSSVPAHEGQRHSRDSASRHEDSDAQLQGPCAQEALQCVRLHGSVSAVRAPAHVDRHAPRARWALQLDGLDATCLAVRAPQH
eukprot:2481481-Alexandrium_andersonii.AAC.1